MHPRRSIRNFIFRGLMKKQLLSYCIKIRCEISNLLRKTCYSFFFLPTMQCDWSKLLFRSCSYVLQNAGAKMRDKKERRIEEEESVLVVTSVSRQTSSEEINVAFYTCFYVYKYNATYRYTSFTRLGSDVDSPFALLIAFCTPTMFVIARCKKSLDIYIYI